MYLDKTILVFVNGKVAKMKKVITKIDNLNKFIENAQRKWEFLKYEIQKFTIDYSKSIAKKREKRRLIQTKGKKSLEQLKF